MSRNAFLWRRIFEVVEMKKIIECRQNWGLFKNAFNIPEPGEKGLAKNLKWMDRINELRRIPAHPARERRYKAEDFEYINFVYDELMKRLKQAQANPVFGRLRTLRKKLMLEPFLKWAGGKRWLVKRRKDLFPAGYQRYVQPFLGGGAVFFELLPNNAVLTDSNEELIKRYWCVRSDCRRIHRALRALHKRHGKRNYYEMRNMSVSDSVRKGNPFHLPESHMF